MTKRITTEQRSDRTFTTAALLSTATASTYGVPLVDEDDDPIVDESGDYITADVPLEDIHDA